MRCGCETPTRDTGLEIRAYFESPLKHVKLPVEAKVGQATLLAMVEFHSILTSTHQLAFIDIIDVILADLLKQAAFLMSGGW